MIRLSWTRIAEASPLGILLLTSLLTRLILIPLFYDDFNGWGYGVFGSILVGGHDPYLVISRDPTLSNINPWRYPPLYLLFTVPALLAKAAADQTIFYLAIIKVPLALSDIISTLFLYRILENQFSKSIALAGATLFTFNPASFFTTVVAGFSDSLAVMFTIIALYCFLTYKSLSGSSASNRLYGSGLFLGIGVMTKIYPLFLIPVFLRDSKNWNDRIVLLATSFFPVAIFSLPFLVWDPYSYLNMLTIKNAGGQHPLFGALGFPAAEQLALLGILAVILAWIYAASLPFYSRLAMTFLWINLATLSTAFQYLTWGIPFFILLLYHSKPAPKLLPLYPIIGVLGALVFNGAYDTFGGSTGPYYWMFHILQQQVVVFRAYPIIGEIASPASSISILLTIYYMARIGSSERFQNFWTRLDTKLNWRISLPVISDRRPKWVPLLFMVLAVLSWTYVALDSHFEKFTYPTLQDNVFKTSFQFRSPILDYQLVYFGKGNYSITTTDAHVTLSSARATNSSICRGWLSVVDGFRPSDSAYVTFRFKLDYLPTSVPSITLAALSGGSLLVARNNTAMSFDYFESTLNTSRTISLADLQWHSFTVNYTQTAAIIALDNRTLEIPPVIFTRVILGNMNGSLPFGRVEYADLFVSIPNFPGGPSSTVFSVIALAAPLAATILAFGVIPGGFLRSRRFRERGSPSVKEVT